LNLELLYLFNLIYVIIIIIIKMNVFDAFLNATPDELCEQMKRGYEHVQAKYALAIFDNNPLYLNKISAFPMPGVQILHYLIGKGGKWFHHIKIMASIYPHLTLIMDDHGNTPLMYALRVREFDIALFLLEIHPECAMLGLDDFGRNSFDVAKACRSPENILVIMDRLRKT
jgi:hypothetical protein